ncbi:MAG: hypothetical protein DHS20C06_02840 [Hyphobacterium sp.]|nr:MAG: hypothetical protein DHS20C06_02840 [Hyphobacterium sp.]
MMQRRGRQYGKIHQRGRVSFAPDITALIVLVAGLFAISQIFTTTTMECRLYYDWHLANRQSGQSLLRTWFVVTGVLTAYFLADVTRPKSRRVAILIRGFQLLLIASMATATIIQWGLLLPNHPHAAQARDLHIAMEHVFGLRHNRILIETIYYDESARPVFPDGFEGESPFAIKAGLLRCEVDAQVEALQWEQWDDSFSQAIPLAITDPRSSARRDPPARP